jgi:hypothetical protein
MRFAVLGLGFAFSGAAWAADSDGDGVEDDVDACPMEDATGHDVYVDGCIDSIDDYAPYLMSLGLDADAEDVLVPLARAAATSMSRGYARLAIVQLHATQGIARDLFSDGTITLDQMRAINCFVRAYVEM